MVRSALYKKPRRKFNFSTFTIVVFVILFIYSLSLILLFGWGFITSLKDQMSDFRLNTLGFPKEWRWDHYTTALSSLNIKVTTADGTRVVYIEEMFLNSILYSVGASIVQTAVTLVMAYLVAKFDNWFSKIIYGIVVVTMILPIVGSLPSEINMAKSLGIFDSIFGIFIMRSSFLGIYFLVFHSMFKGISKDYDEAARIDGASNLRIMLEVNFPLVKNTVITVLLLSFIGYWNDFSIPMIYLPTHPTLASGLYWFNQSTVGSLSNTPMKLAGCMVVVIPILIIFMIFNNRIMGNISTGGIKE